MMNPTAKLLELQELELVIAESRILLRRENDQRTDEVGRKVAALRRELDSDVLARYDRLREQGMAVAKVVGGICGGCRLNIPQGDVIRMKKSETIPACPNCGRFLNLAVD